MEGLRVRRDGQEFQVEDLEALYRLASEGKLKRSDEVLSARGWVRASELPQLRTRFGADPWDVWSDLDEADADAVYQGYVNRGGPLSDGRDQVADSATPSPEPPTPPLPAPPPRPAPAPQPPPASAPAAARPSVPRPSVVPPGARPQTAVRAGDPATDPVPTPAVVPAAAPTAHPCPSRRPRRPPGPAWRHDGPSPGSSPAARCPPVGGPCPAALCCR